MVLVKNELGEAVEKNSKYEYGIDVKNGLYWIRRTCKANIRME